MTAMIRTATTVAEVMVSQPKTHPAETTTVAQLRRFFADDHVHAALLVQGASLIAVCDRADLSRGFAAEAADDELAYLFGRLDGRIVRLDADLEKTTQVLEAKRLRRLTVIDAAGQLVGLLCRKSSGKGFCSDVDVAARAAAVTHVRRS